MGLFGSPFRPNIANLKEQRNVARLEAIAAPKARRFDDGIDAIGALGELSESVPLIRLLVSWAAHRDNLVRYGSAISISEAESALSHIDKALLGIGENFEASRILAEQ